MTLCQTTLCQIFYSLRRIWHRKRKIGNKEGAATTLFFVSRLWQRSRSNFFATKTVEIFVTHSSHRDFCIVSQLKLDFEVCKSFFLPKWWWSRWWESNIFAEISTVRVSQAMFVLLPPTHDMHLLWTAFVANTLCLGQSVCYSAWFISAYHGNYANRHYTK